MIHYVSCRFSQCDNGHGLLDDEAPKISAAGFEASGTKRRAMAPTVGGRWETRRLDRTCTESTIYSGHVLEHAWFIGIA